MSSKPSKKDIFVGKALSTLLSIPSSSRTLIDLDHVIDLMSMYYDQAKTMSSDEPDAEEIVNKLKTFSHISIIMYCIDKEKRYVNHEEIVSSYAFQEWLSSNVEKICISTNNLVNMGPEAAEKLILSMENIIK